MLNLERSLIYNYWEYFLISGIFGFFIWKLFGKTVKIEETSKTFPDNSDEKIIGQDAKFEYDNDDEEDTPSLEVMQYIKYPGVTKTLSGGVNEFYDGVNNRRSIRSFSSKPVDIELIKKAILCAGTSPSGDFLLNFYIVSLRSVSLQKNN